MSIANFCGTNGDIDKRKTTLSTTIPPTFDKKIGELWSTNNEFSGLTSTHTKSTFSEDHILVLRGAAPSNSYMYQR